jgi:hypothetical protein
MTTTSKTIYKAVVGSLFCWLVLFGVADAASLQVNPGTGVYAVGNTFTAQVQVRTAGQSINASEGTLKFNPNELSVVSINRSSSIFNLWVTEPTFSNSAGTITFSGGVPTGFSGSVGNVLTVTFRVKNAGSPRVSFTKGAVLANDGRGTNVLTTMNGGSYTAQAVASTPVAEVIEYVAPANTPAAPQINSTTHPDPAKWSTESTAKLTWTLPVGITSVRTLLDDRSSTVPTKVYDTPIDSISLTDLAEGVSYFHLQFRNEDGWGRIAHYRLAVDSVAPTDIVITTASSSSLDNPEQVLLVATAEETSAIASYVIKIDDSEAFEFTPTDTSGLITLPVLTPGYHAVIIEVLDAAGNSTIGTHSFTIQAFEKPVFTDVPAEMTANVIPVIKGLTRPGSLVSVFFSRIGSESDTSEVTADDQGVFTFVPDSALYNGVYEISVQATDQYGAQSELSEIKRIAVQEPGYIKIGSQVVNIMSVIVPLILLSLLLVFGVWYLLFVYRRFRGVVRIESLEALDILHREFRNLQSVVRSQESALLASRKTKKLTKAESEMVAVLDKALQTSQKAVEKEIQDVTRLTKD